MALAGCTTEQARTWAKRAGNFLRVFPFLQSMHQNRQVMQKVPYFAPALLQ
jgi:hypothetical protein